MTVNAPINENPLELAANQLRGVCDDRVPLASPFDAGSLSRMLVHIRNINVSVLASVRDHANAAKRLNDFATTLLRIAKSSEAAEGALASRMATVAANLRAASQELAGANVIPNWRTSIY